MAFHERMYKCFVILGDPEAPPVWEWNRWQAFASLLDPIIGLSRDKALARSGQFHKGSRKEVKFGRLGWGPGHHRKWVHESPATQGKSKEWDFFFVEVSAPSLPQSWREKIPSDVFFTLRNEGYITKEIPLLFNPKVFVAIAEEIALSAEGVLRKFVEQTSRFLNAKLVAEISRPWGFSFGGSMYQDAIMDIAHTGLFKVGSPHSRPLDLETFQEPWQRLNIY